MNIIITSSLILIWSNYNKPINITSNVNELNYHCINETSHSLEDYPNSKKFISKMIQGSTDDIQISSILNIRKDSISKTKYLRFIHQQNKSKESKVSKVSSNTEFDPNKNYEEYLDKTVPLNPAPQPPNFPDSLFIVIAQRFDRLKVKPLNQQLKIVEGFFNKSGLPKTANVKDLNNSLKTTIEIPILKKSVSTDQAIILISFFILFPLLLFLSITRTITRHNFDKKDGISWVFFHSGNLGLILGIIQVFVPFLSLIYVIIMRRMEFLYSIPISFITLFLGVLCTKEVLKARKNFYNSLN